MSIADDLASSYADQATTLAARTSRRAARSRPLEPGACVTNRVTITPPSTGLVGTLVDGRHAQSAC